MQRFDNSSMRAFRRATSLFAVWTGILLAAPASSRATTWLPIDFVELVQGARAVAYGRVVDARSEWAAGRRRVDTLVTLAVRDYFKGDLGPRVTIRVPGGRLGRYRTVLIGAPHLAAGDEVVLFLNAQNAAAPHIMGLGQGVFRVRVDPKTAALVVAPTPFVARSPSAERIVRGDPSRLPLPLPAFAALVRSISSGVLPAAAVARR